MAFERTGNCLTADNYDISFEYVRTKDKHDIANWHRNPRGFIISRWRAAVDSYRLPEADQDLVDNVKDAQSFRVSLRHFIRQARAAGHFSSIKALNVIAALNGPLRQFAELIVDVKEGVQSVLQDVHVDPLWAMLYLNVKLSIGSVDKLRRTSSWMNDFGRQIQLLLLSLQSTPGEKLMMLEMSEIFEPALGILFDSIVYLQKHLSDETFTRNWYSVMQVNLKQHLEQMEGTVKHIRAMGVAKQINQITEIRSDDLSLRDRSYLMDGSEKAIFPVENLPLTKTQNFTGRSNEIENIHSWLGTTDNKRLRTYLIYGRRGIGKTQIALEYCARYSSTYDAIFWIQCETNASLRQSFADIAMALELDGPDNGSFFEENMRKVNNWLRQTDKKWLLIYDNAERENLLKGYWPVGARGKILLTSRTYYNFFEDDQRKGKTVPFFTSEESYANLMAQLGPDWQTAHLSPGGVMSEVEKLSARTLLKEIGGLPLAIKYASRLILNREVGMTRPGGRGDDSIHGFLELFDQSSKALPQRQSGPRNPTVHSLDTIWSIAFDALSSNTRAILQVLALVSPDEILIDLFQPSDQARLTEKLAFCQTKGLSSVVPPALDAVILSSPELQSAIDELIEQGMVSGTRRNLTIHREVQEAVNYQGAVDLEDSFDAAAYLLYDAFPQQGNGPPLTDEKVICRRWIQHAIALATRYKQYSIEKSASDDPLKGIASSEIFVKLLANCAWYLDEVANHDVCLDLIAIACIACRDQNSLDYARLKNTEGLTYYKLNKLKRSREAHEIARQIRQSMLCAGHAEIAISMGNLGNVESALGNYDEAQELLLQAARIREAIGNDAAVYLGLTYLQLGRVEFLRNNLEEAFRYYQRCEGVLMTEAGQDKWVLAELYYAYGNRELALSEFSCAHTQYERALRICQDINPLHPLTAAVYYKTGCTESEQGNHSKAISNLEKALDIAELRSPNVVDGTIARIQWKRAEVTLDYLITGPKGCENSHEFRNLMDDMCLRQTSIAESMDIDLRGTDEWMDREKSFDLLVAGCYR